MKKQTFKNILLVTTVLALLLIGLGLYFIWKDQVNEDEDRYSTSFGNLPTPVNTLASDSLEIDYKAISSELKTSEKVYRINNNDSFYPDEEFSRAIATNLELTETSTGEDFMIYYNEAGDSLLYETAGLFTLKLSSFDKTESITDEQKLIEIAKEKLIETNLWPWEKESEYTIKKRYYYTIGYNFYETNDREEASLLGITFQNALDGIPILTSRINSGAIHVILDLSGNIIQIEYEYRSTDTDESATYPIITLDEALEEINYENFELVTPFESFDPTNVQITDVEFAYRVVGEDMEYLEPCYFFEGTDEHGQLVTLIVPAVRDEYLTVE